MTRIACYADLHGVLPDPVDCDLAIIAGDICPECRRSPIMQLDWFMNNFIPWVQKFEKSVWIAGNHDYALEDKRSALGLSFLSGKDIWLNDDWEDVAGYKIWGSPWSLPYGNYAFMAPEQLIAQRLNFKDINPDIIVSHGPPFLHGDAVYRPHWHANEHTGSKALLDKIRQHKPKLVVCGHIHEGRGVSYEGETLIVNAAMAGESPGLGLEYPPIIVDFDEYGLTGVTT